MFDYNSTLFWYRFVFLLELIFCETIFLYHLKKRKHFIIKFPICVLVCFLLTACIPIPVYNWAYTSFTFFLIYIFTLVSMFVLFKESIMAIVFCSIAGYSTQHICFQTFSFISVATAPISGPEYGVYGNRLPASIEAVISDVLIYFVVFITVVTLVWYFLGRKIKKNTEIVIQKPVIIVVTLLFVLVSIVLNAISTYNSYVDYSKIDLLVSSSLSIFICVLSLCMQFLSFNQVDLEKQLDIANHIIREEVKQYHQSKQNIELINLKCHDLKHQIRKLGVSKNISEKELQEIASMIQFYDFNIKTGNSVLDTVLLEKSLECSSKSISITCLIDGNKLSFMDETDLYSLFGNAFDNAIESSVNLEKEQRVISLTSSEKNNLFFVSLKNYVKEKPVFIDGLPQTTKENKDFHGFGMKSMKRIIEKYNGHLHCFYENHIFTLSIMFELDQINVN